MNPKSRVKSGRSLARSFALQAVYQWLLTGENRLNLEKQARDQESFQRADREFYSQLLAGVTFQHAQLSERLLPFIDRPLQELSPIEHSVLLLAAYELLELSETPYKVIINEAIELTKTFGGIDGHKFVNGVLDRLAAQARPHEVTAQRSLNR